MHKTSIHAPRCIHRIGAAALSLCLGATTACDAPGASAFDEPDEDRFGVAIGAVGALGGGGGGIVAGLSACVATVVGAAVCGVATGVIVVGGIAYVHWLGESPDEADQLASADALTIGDAQNHSASAAAGSRLYDDTLARVRARAQYSSKVDAIAGYADRITSRVEFVAAGYLLKCEAPADQGGYAGGDACLGNAAGLFDCVGNGGGKACLGKWPHIGQVVDTRVLFMSADEASEQADEDASEACRAPAQGSGKPGTPEEQDVARRLSRMLSFGHEGAVVLLCSPAQWNNVVTSIKSPSPFTHRTARWSDTNYDDMQDQMEAARSCGEAPLVVVKDIHDRVGDAATDAADRLNVWRPNINKLGMVVFLSGQALFKAMATNPHFLSQASVLACE